MQLYTRDPQASVTRPERELKGFLRLTLEPGETRRITFRVPVAQLGFYDRDLSYVIEPGEIEAVSRSVLRGHGRRGLGDRRADRAEAREGVPWVGRR